MTMLISRFLRALLRRLRPATPGRNIGPACDTRLDDRFLDDAGLPRGPAVALLFGRPQS